MYPMKNLFFIGCALFFLPGSPAAAQQKIPLNQQSLEKPSLFSDLPEKSSRVKGSLENLFSLEPQSGVKTQLNQHLRIEGVVLEKVVVSPQQCNINIRCSNLQNALLNVSRIQLPDGSFKYSGRIVSPVHGDIIMLGSEADPLAVIKQKQTLTLVE
jgi:hypothetical protein